MTVTHIDNLGPRPRNKLRGVVPEGREGVPLGHSPAVQRKGRGVGGRGGEGGQHGGQGGGGTGGHVPALLAELL